MKENIINWIVRIIKVKFQSKYSIFNTRKWIWKSPKWRSFSLDPNVLINTHFQLYTGGYQLNRKSKLKTFNVNWILESKFQWNIDKDETTLIQENAFENVNKMAAILSRPHLVNCVLIKHNQVSQLYSPPKTELIHKISWNLTDVWLITSNCSNSNTTNSKLHMKINPKNICTEVYFTYEYTARSWTDTGPNLVHHGISIN